MSIDDLTSKQKDYAVFLPAISGFYATFIGKQRFDPMYVDPARFPKGLTDMEQLNWLNTKSGLYQYKWSLYSGGHANLDMSKADPSEDMVRNREEGSFILGDSGGFQIAKGLWEGDWKAGSGCPKAQKKREQVLNWLDSVADYGMILDIPTWVIHDKKSATAAGFNPNNKALALQQAIDATKFNNEYFMKHRKGVKNGGTKFLNVLQGDNHTSAENWYQIMKDYCDPKVYPDTHFNGWAMGGQNMCDVHLILKRIIALKYDNLLQEGVHDWIHFLGTSKLEWAVLLTVLQRAIRKHINPKLTISFDCASPFLATANGQAYYENVFPHEGKWSYKMGPTADNKKYALDTRKWSDGVVQDGFYPRWENSPVSDILTMKDICIYKPGVRKSTISDEEFDFTNPDHYDVLPDFNKNGKWGKTSWDSFSYALLMSHNVWMHLTAVQEANRRFDNGEHPAMLRQSYGEHEYFEDIIEKIFSAPTKEESDRIIDKYSLYWMHIPGTRGFSGKKTLNSLSTFNSNFDYVDDEEPAEDSNEENLDENLLNELDDQAKAA